MLKLNFEMDAKLTDLERRSRRENIRIQGVKEGLEEDAPSMVAIVERLLRQKLELPDSGEVRGERAHRALNLDHDYAPEVLKQRKEYAQVKAALKEKKIRFQTPFPAKMRVFYPEGTVVYSSVEEATSDLAKRGFPVTVIKHPETFWSRFDIYRGAQRERPGAR